MKVLSKESSPLLRVIKEQFVNFRVHTWKEDASYRYQIKITILHGLLLHSAQLPDTDYTYCVETPAFVTPKTQPSRRQKLDHPVSPNIANFTGK